MAVTNTLKLNSLRKRLPARVISGNVHSVSAIEGWLYDDDAGDPWWQGAAGVPYRWLIHCTVSIVNHSSHLTRKPFVYSGLDITHDMWVMGATEAKALRVISIKNKTDNTVDCIVEDVDRYNTFTDPSGTGAGIFSVPLNVIFFELGEDGLPIINPIPFGVNIGVVSQVEARFRVLNSTVEQKFFQLRHGFKEGQVLKLNPTTQLFENATSNDIYMVGTVVSAGPGPNYFYVEPSTKFIQNLEPALSGNPGDIFWLDKDTGDRTSIPGRGDVPVYIQITSAVPSFIIGSVSHPVTNGYSIIRINGVLVTMGTQGSASTSTMITAINQATASHGVTASLSPPATVIHSTVTFPQSAINPVMSFSINGTTMTIGLPSIKFGNSGLVGYWDVVREINEQTYAHGVLAEMNIYTGVLSLTNSSGGEIIINNISPATTIGNFKCFSDMLGVPTTNLPSVPDRIKLTRFDGGEIIIADVSGTFLTDSGLQSVGNGTMPLALVVDKTMISTANLIVPDIAARDALTNVRAGDQVFVQSAAYDEWALYIHTGSGWILISDYDSAKTDASTLVGTLDHTNSSPVLLGSISDQSQIVNVTVTVEEDFNDTATISIGLLGSPDIIMGNDTVDLTELGVYEASPSYTFQGVNGANVMAFLNPGLSTTGKIKIAISYL